MHDNIKIEMSDTMKDGLVKKYLNRVAKFVREHCYEAREKRKSLENYSLKKKRRKEM